MLLTETNTRAVERRIRKAAHARFGRRRIQTDFEHGQWWITILDTGAQYSVEDAESGSAIDGIDFEQVTEGDT